MPDYIIRQTPAANVTVISSPNQIVLQQPQPVTVCLSTGGTSYVLLPATNATLGGVKVGANLTVDANGVLAATAAAYTLPVATNGTLGGVKVGANLTVDANGVLAAVGGMTQIANVTYGVSQIPNSLLINNARYVAGLKANTTTAAGGNNTIVTESYSGLGYNPTTNVSLGHVAGFTDTYSDPNLPFKKQQFEVRASTLSYSALNQANAIVFSAGFSVAAFGGAQLYFQNNLDGVSTQMQVDGSGVTMYTDGVVTVNGDEVVTLEVAKTLFAPLTFKGG